MFKSKNTISNMHDNCVNLWDLWDFCCFLCQARIQDELSHGDFLKVILIPIPSKSCEVKDNLGRAGKWEQNCHNSLIL